MQTAGARYQGGTRPGTLLFADELAAAASLVEQAQTVTEATGSNPRALRLAVLRGRETKASALIRDTRQEVAQQGED